MMTPTDPDAAFRQRLHEKKQAARRGSMRRAIYRAKASGGTVPFSIREMLELGCSAHTIRAVYRNEGTP